jgi:hypothetical protein
LSEVLGHHLQVFSQAAISMSPTMMTPGWKMLRPVATLGMCLRVSLHIVILRGSTVVSMVNTN